jgi:hypothetical protein
MASPSKKTTNSTASFFFRAKPKKVLAKVKRVLDRVEIIDSDDGEGETKKPRLIDEREITIITDEPREILPIVKEKYRHLLAVCQPALPLKEATNIVPVLMGEPALPGSPVKVIIRDNFPYYQQDTTLHRYEYFILSVIPMVID